MTTQNLLDWLQEAEDNNIWDVSTQSVKRHLEKIQQTEQLRIGGVSQQRELLIALKDCRKWMINKGVNVESEFFKKIDEAINCG